MYLALFIMFGTRSIQYL